MEMHLDPQVNPELEAFSVDTGGLPDNPYQRALAGYFENAATVRQTPIAVMTTLKAAVSSQ